LENVETMPPDTAFVIPARNAAATLDMTMESVMGQTCGSWEAIVVDDGSTDQTPARIAAWEGHDSRICSVWQAPSGLAAARNTGALLAQASYLVFLDADDLLAPDYLRLMLQEATESPDAALVHCAGSRLTPDGRVGTPEVPPTSEYFRHLVAYNPFFVHSCMLKRSVFATFGGFDETLPAVEEWDLWQRLARAKLPFAAVDQSLTIYRMRPESMVRDHTRVLPSAMRVIRRGHAADPRVANPAPEFAEGWPDGNLDSRVFNITLWVAGVTIGANRELAPLLALLSAAPKSTVPLILSELFEGILVGACALPIDWPDLLPGIRDPLRRLLKHIEQVLGHLDFSDDPRRHLFETVL
jgi:glycosyltransferase involved in cell wall biosynthesis